MAGSTTNLGLTKPTYAESQDVTILNGDMDLIDAEAGRVRGNFAGTYSASSAYAVGDYCVYGGNLYRCTTAIGSSGEAWNANHWTQVNVGDELGTLSEQIGNANRATISSRLSSSYGTVTAYEAYLGKLCAVAISFNCTTAIAKNVTFMTGLKDSVVNRAPVVPMYNTDDGKLYHANVSSSGELTSHTEALPTGNYRMNFAYVIN